MSESFYKMIIPERLNMTDLVLNKWSNNRDLVAICQDKERITYNDLTRTVAKLGNCLKTAGIKPGERIILRMSNHAMYIALNMAIIKIGAIAVPTSTLFREREISHIIQNSKAKFAIAMPEFLNELASQEGKSEYLKKIFTIVGKEDNYESVEELSSKEDDTLSSYNSSKNDIAFILYTSGTTSFPKGVPHAHRWLLALGEPNSDFVMGIRSGDRILTPSEMTWMWPWGYCIWFAMYKGASTCIYTGRFDPEKTFECIENYQATHIVGNPTIYRRLLRIEGGEKRYNLSSLRSAFSSGETLAPELFNEWKKRFDCEIYDCLGQTESHVFCSTRPGSVKLGSIGKPLPGIPVSIINEDGSQCKSGEIGYLAMNKHFEGLTSGYLDMPEEWNRKVRGQWYLTWDYALFDDDGFFWYVSRSDDLIKSRGYLIAPKEIEDVLQEHTSVFESSVIGANDTEMRERVVAIIVLREKQVPSQELALGIRKYVSERIAPFKSPKEIIFVDSIPKTVTGKIMRKTLKEEYEKPNGTISLKYRYTF